MKARTEIMVSLAAVLMISTISHFSIMANERAPEDMMDGQLYKVECTAYCYTGQPTASGAPTVEDLTIAGAREWLGCTCALYDEDKQFLGYYEFKDIGYGRDGDIERGETVDLYLASESDCNDLGRRTMYIQIIPSEG